MSDRGTAKVKGKATTKAKHMVARAEKADIAAGHAAARIGAHPVVDRIAQLGALADQPPLIALSIATIGAGLLLRRRRLARVGVRMLAAHGLATAVKGFVKRRVDRHRPHVEGGDHRIKPGENGADSDCNSFPSGHSAGAVAVARAVVRDYPNAAGSAGAAASFAVLAPLPAGRHFPIDVAAGTLIGLAAEAVVSAVMRGGQD